MWRNWSNLPTELLEMIIQRLISNFPDIIRFRSVCKSWKYIALKKPPTPPPQLPWLMLASTQFYSLSDNKAYSIQLPETCSKRCSGSSQGWLFLENTFVSCSLLNPVTKFEIALPLLRSVFGLGTPYYKRFMEVAIRNNSNLIVKVALSSSPSYDANVVSFVMLIIGHPLNRRLALCKLGDKIWTPVGRSGTYQDVAYFKGQFYVVDSYGAVVVFSVGDRPRFKDFKGPESVKADQNYLVDLSGELLLVRRFRRQCAEQCTMDRTNLFAVSRQDPDSKNWFEMKDLGTQTLFLGRNQSFAVFASDFLGCKGNCIYFTDHYYMFCQMEVKLDDVGIFNLADGSIEPLPGYKCDFQLRRHPPLWIVASPW